MSTTMVPTSCQDWEYALLREETKWKDGMAIKNHPVSISCPNLHLAKLGPSLQVAYRLIALTFTLI
jgi:hypothetical protein